jgi:hypothetical protein
MEGWIINAHGAGSYKLARAGQQPIFYIGIEPIFEVWFWDGVARLWFVMVADLHRVTEQGAVGFHPLHTREQITALRDQWRAYRAAGGSEPNSATRN